MTRPFGLAVQIVALLQSRRLPLADEKELQAAIGDQLMLESLTYQREVRLGPADVVDFMVHDVAIEVKIKGSKRNVYRQCERYCSHARVGALILATNYMLGFPATINGKPCFVANLGRAWL